MGKMFFYAVSIGRNPGVYDTWDQCEEQVRGFQGARFKKFASQSDAIAFTGLKGKQAETTRAAAGNPSTITAKLMLRNENKNPALNIRDIGSKSSDVTSSPYNVFASAKESSREKTLVVYCDGACKGNGSKNKAAGLGVWWGENDERNLAERVPAEQTNNRAELLAIVRVLEQVPEGDESLIIKTDSQYSIKCVTEWAPKWIRNGWKKFNGDAVLNKEVIHYLLSLLELRKTLGQNVVLQHVKGHVGILGNEMADLQANLGAAMPEILDEPDWASMREGLELRTRNLSCKIIADASQLNTHETVQSETQSSLQDIFGDDFITAEELLSGEELQAEFNEATS